MIATRKLGKMVSLAAFFGLALYASVYFMAGHSDAFKFIEQRIRNSEAVKAQVGDIKSIRPSLFGTFDHKTVDSDEWVSMTLDVTGTERSIEVVVQAKKAYGSWTLDKVESSGQKIDAK
jgi:hypothetical protein